jgi:hypothetical protein
MKPIVFTFHAPARMAERQIASEWIERTIREPAWTEPDPKDPHAERRYRPIPENGDRVLRVVVAETETGIRVIAVTFDRGATRRHARHHARPGS